MRQWLFILFIFNPILSTVSGQSDSLSFFNTKNAESQTVSNGIKYVKIHIGNNQLFNSNQFISIIEITPGYNNKLEIYASPILKKTSEIAKENGAIAAINGSFFKFNYEYNVIDYNSSDYIRKANRVLAQNSWPAKGRAIHQLGALAIFKGNLYILKADRLREWEKYIQAEEVLTSGPILIVNNKNIELDTSSFYTTRHPRTAVGKRDDGTILLVVVDGRNREAAGMSLQELQTVMKWLGSAYAINLDGGGSTTMYIKGYSDNGVVNHPTDNRLFNNKGERKVANAILIYAD